MSTEGSNNPFFSVHLPITLVAIALTVFFAGHGSDAALMTKRLQADSDGVDKRLKYYEDRQIKNNAEKRNYELNKTKDNVQELIKKRADLVAQSQSLQAKFTDLMKELDVLARGGDKDAKMIIEGYGIQINENPDAKPADKPADAKPEEKKPEAPKAN